MFFPQLKKDKMQEDIEAKQCQQILRKNNLYPIKKLGKGAFGVVYLVSRTSMKGHEPQLFAVKCTNKKIFAKKPMLKSYLKQQIDIQSGVIHPNVVKLIRTYEDQGWNFMIMEYCDGGNICNYQSLKPKKVYDLSQAKKYMTDVLEGLKHLHQNNIIHRDLKLQNVLLMRDPKNNQEIRAKICDFGFAKQTQDQASTFCGTTYFMAPQIFAKKKYDGYIDIWAAGVILFYMLFAVYPFKSINMINEIQNKCKDGFKMQNIKGLIQNQSVKKEDKKILCKLFEKIFKIQPNQRISICQFLKYMIPSSPRKSQQQTSSSDNQFQQIIQTLSSKIVFIQKVYQQVKNIQFLTISQQLALKYHLDKYCLTLILMNNKICQKNTMMSKLRKQLYSNQQKDAALLALHMNKIDIPKFAQFYTTVYTQDFNIYKQSYRLVLSHVFTKANRQIQNLTTRAQIKLKIFCCHSINRVFEQQFIKDIFYHFYQWRIKKYNKISEEFKVQEIMNWINQDNPQRMNDTIKIMTDKFYKKTK